VFNELACFRDMNEGKSGIYNPTGFRLYRLRGRLQTAIKNAICRGFNADATTFPSQRVTRAGSPA
jgi:hypothetical protein